MAAISGRNVSLITKKILQKGHEYEYITDSMHIIKFLEKKNIQVFNLKPEFDKKHHEYKSLDMERKEEIFSNNYNYFTLIYINVFDNRHAILR